MSCSVKSFDAIVEPALNECLATAARLDTDTYRSEQPVTGRTREFVDIWT